MQHVICKVTSYQSHQLYEVKRLIQDEVEWKNKGAENGNTRVKTLQTVLRDNLRYFWLNHVFDHLVTSYFAGAKVKHFYIFFLKQISLTIFRK